MLILDGQLFQPDEILVKERHQMIDYLSGIETSGLWELDGLPEHHIQLVITRLIDTPVGQLLSLPRIRLQGSNVCDTGGVFRAKINETFDYLLRQSDLFTLNRVFRRYSFMPHSHVSLQVATKAETISSIREDTVLVCHYPRTNSLSHRSGLKRFGILYLWIYSARSVRVGESGIC